MFRVGFFVSVLGTAQLPAGDAPVKIRFATQQRLHIPAGPFRMGASTELQRDALALCVKEIGPNHAAACKAALFSNESPERRVFLGAYEIDRHEVSLGQYRACVSRGACSPLPLVPRGETLDDAFPVTSVTFEEASQFCRAAGGRLPSEAEWERAARGTDGRMFPWGNAPVGSMCNHGRFSGDEISQTAGIVLRTDDEDGFTFLAPALSFADAVSPTGAYNMAGNVTEWVADAFTDEAPQATKLARPHGPEEGPLRTVRGGSFREPMLYQRTTSRQGVPAASRSTEIGFRCAYQ